MNLKPVKLNVTLLAKTEPVNGSNPEAIVAAAAKLCYSKSSAATLLEGLDEEKTREFLKRLSDMGHQSPTEHLYFTFGIEGISRACSHQLVRHRIASYNQQSQRYVDLSGDCFVVVPPEIEKNSELLSDFLSDAEDEFKKYADTIDKLENMYLINFPGEIDKKTRLAIHKQALEDARSLLPNACETKIIMTMNARSLLNFFSERCCNRAQWEIREMAEQMKAICQKEAPTIFRHAGAPCEFGRCNEGPMTCGKPKVRKRGNLCKGN